MSVETCSPEANYLTRNNIVHADSAFIPAATLTAKEAAGRAEMAARNGIASVSGGSITKGKG